MPNVQQVFNSFKKIVVGGWGPDADLRKIPDCGLMPQGYFYKELVDLLKHIRENLDSNPIIICTDDLQVGTILNEYYEIVDEARPLSGFVSTHADFLYRNAFLIVKISNPPSLRAIRALIASQSTFEI